MNFGAALDVAMGLIFVYLLVSLFVTALNEYISSFLNKRSEYLLARVQSLLGGGDSPEPDGAWSPMMCSVWNHPLINGLKSHGQTEDHCTKRGALLKNAPSYIPGQAFAVALTETLKPSDKTQLSFNQLKTAVASIENNEPLRQALLPMLDKAEGRVDVFQTAVATWFDGAMDRASGTYKRWVHRLTFWAGFMVAIAFNVNSLQLIDNLWRDPVARAGLVAQASLTSQANDARDAQSRLAGGAAPPEEAGQCGADGQRGAALAQDLPLPIGWSSEKLCALVREPLSSQPPSKHFNSVCQTPYRSPLSIGLKMLLTLLGLAITGLAVSLGSPFWFGILQSVTNIRSTGIKPDRADGTTQR